MQIQYFGVKVVHKSNREEVEEGGREIRTKWIRNVF
jgi:hypothetical protein